MDGRKKSKKVIGEISMYDVVIIGAGVVGCAIARELSRYEVKACVIEKDEDVCNGTSKANSAISHAGFDAMPGTLKAKLNVEGNLMMEELSKELDFPYKQIGALVVCTKETDQEKLQELYNRGIKNGVEGLRILGEREVRKMESNLSDQVVAALYAPTSGIVCPFHMTIAFAENAFENGVEFKLNTKVENIQKEEDRYVVETSDGTFKTRAVVNAAGVYADEIHNMVSQEQLKIVARRGDYCLLDKTAGEYVSRTIFPLPNKFGKGVLVSPTIHGNLIVGPTAMDVEDKEANNVKQDGIDFLMEKGKETVADLPMRQVITSFAGLRAHESKGDFTIGEPKDAKYFFDAAGIESPGLTSAPAIGVMVAEMIKDALHLAKKRNFVSKRKGILNPQTLSKEERIALVQEHPEYGNIICRCEMVTEGEILDAIHRPLGAKSLDGIKRRTRAGMGRCQSGFCSPRTMEILARELEVPMADITKSGGQSKIIAGINKDCL